MVGTGSTVRPCTTSWQLAPPTRVSEGEGWGEKGLAWSTLCAHGLQVSGDVPIVAAQVSPSSPGCKTEASRCTHCATAGSNGKQVFICIASPTSLHIRTLLRWKPTRQGSFSPLQSYGLRTSEFKKARASHIPESCS